MKKHKRVIEKLVELSDLRFVPPSVITESEVKPLDELQA